MERNRPLEIIRIGGVCLMIASALVFVGAVWVIVAHFVIKFW